jgi:hypothetical protein
MQHQINCITVPCSSASAVCLQDGPDNLKRHSLTHMAPQESLDPLKHILLSTTNRGLNRLHGHGQATLNPSPGNNPHTRGGSKSWAVWSGYLRSTERSILCHCLISSIKYVLYRLTSSLIYLHRDI